MKKYLFVLFAFASLHSFGQDTCIYTFNFPSDEFSLSKTQRKSLDSLLTDLDEPLNTFVYYIQGHTDSTGNKQYNIDLSERRCGSVKKYLIKKGVEQAKISFEKFGYDLPIATNETETGRANNRRTTLTIISKFSQPDWNILPQKFEINVKGETTVKTKNACKIVVPENAFLLPDALPVSGKIELEVLEYNNPAYFIASGIPMSYEASGKLFMYHSEEMLSIKAFYNGTALELKNDVKITLNCREVDSLYVTGFYKFNLHDQKWFEEDKLKVTSEPVLQEKTAKKETEKILKTKEKNEKIVVSSKEGTVSTTNDNKVDEPIRTETIVIADKIENRPAKIKALKIDTGTYIKVKIDTGGVSVRRRKQKVVVFDTAVYRCSVSCCDAEYYARVGKEFSKKPIDLFGVEWSGGRGVDLYADKNYMNLFLKDWDDKLENNKYYHIKLITTKLFLRKKAVVKFKYDKEKNPELKALKKVKWIYNFKKNTMDYESFAGRMYNDLRIVYDAKSKTCDVKLEERDTSYHITLKPKEANKAFEAKMKKYQKGLTHRIMSVYTCFSNFDRIYVSKSTRNLSFFTWVNNFNAHLDQMHRRYDSLSKMDGPLLLKYLNCKCGIPRDSIPPDSCDRGKRLFKPSGPNRILIIGLGVYNYDKVIPIEDIVDIDAPIFVTRRGKIIKPKESFLILGGINGMIHFDKGKGIWLVEKHRNTLFIVDQANRRYKAVFETTEDLHHLPKKIVLKNITEQTRDLKGLETELLGK